MKLFKKNVGSTDQIIRFLIGAGFISMYFLAETQAVQWTGLVIGVIALLTVLFSFCPVYALFGLNTRGTGKSTGKRGGGESPSDKVRQFESKAGTEKAHKTSMEAGKEKEKEKEEHKTAA